MAAMWSTVKARLSHRLAMHVPVATARLANARPMVSFTFDDVPRSAVVDGAAALEARGATGTFYVSGGSIGAQDLHWDLADADELVALHAKGHELACHTFSHRRVHEMNATVMRSDLDKNRNHLETLASSIKICNFAYPFGLGSFSGKRRLRSKFKSCRSIVPGINRGNVDLQFLRAVPLIERETDRRRIDRLMDATVATNGWLIFYTHDVAETPSLYGCSPRFLDYALEAAARREISILNVSKALSAGGI
jgi:peptidoglycan/xylan/chitin deacetylase (PgdA/CDA1 family)